VKKISGYGNPMRGVVPVFFRSKTMPFLGGWWVGLEWFLGWVEWGKSFRFLKNDLILGQKIRA